MKDRGGREMPDWMADVESGKLETSPLNAKDVCRNQEIDFGGGATAEFPNYCPKCGGDNFDDVDGKPYWVNDMRLCLSCADCGTHFSIPGAFNFDIGEEP